MSDIRRDFPILAREHNGRPLIYLDNAATTQKPQAVIDAVSEYYVDDCANVHRSVHYLAERATTAYEEAAHGTGTATRAGIHQRRAQ